MFKKQSSYSNEILDSMVKNLKANHTSLENSFKQSNLQQATILVSNAASMFEKIGMNKEAADLTKFLTKLAGMEEEKEESEDEADAMNAEDEDITFEDEEDK